MNQIAATVDSTTTAPAARRWLPGFALVAIAYMIFLSFDQMHWWQLKSDYSFGWLVPLFVGYVLFERWPQMQECLRATGPSPLPAGGSWILTLIAGAMLVGGLFVFGIAALYRAGAGPTQPGSLMLAAGFAVILPALAFLSAPAGAVVSPTSGVDVPRRDARLRLVGLLVFPALVWLISAPLVSAVENALSLFLLRKVVAVVFFVFDLLGFPLLQEGNVLMLPRGQVGVADACSGIRSLTGCLFAGAFLSAVWLKRFWSKALLLAAALTLAFFTNLLRSLFLTAWAYAYGSEAIEGTLHDATGYAVLILTSAGLFGLLFLTTRRKA